MTGIDTDIDTDTNQQTDSHVASGLFGKLHGWSSLTAEQLYFVWIERFESEEEAVARAVWAANKLVKLASRSTRIKFYSIKGEFVRRHADEAYIVREEVKTCYACDEGVTPDGDLCDHCDGFGVYSRKTLYAHQFKVAGTIYRLHGYSTPRVILPKPDEPERDGYTFTVEENATLALPVSGFMKLLSYVAAARWEMVFDGEEYQRKREENDDE